MIVDDVRRGKDWTRPLFNVAQYTLTITATRWVYCLAAGQDLLVPETFERADLGPALLAGATLFAVNHGLVGTAVALWPRQPVPAHLHQDIRFQLSTAGLLVYRAPLVILATDVSLWLVPVLLLPMAAVRKSPRWRRSESTTRCTTS
ncbi:MAG: diguanylate cyclase/phosphodiesterase [Frankiales bacterium]|jgi:hypothetical protein|nr:diguanylate cyclase/phosphodiesterase [Frankiales bacterium]